MKKDQAQVPLDDDQDNDDWVADVSFANGKPNPYASRFTSGAQVVSLSDELRREFPTAESIEEALEMLLEIRKTLARSARAAGDAAG